MCDVGCQSNCDFGNLLPPITMLFLKCSTMFFVFQDVFGAVSPSPTFIFQAVSIDCIKDACE